MALGLTQNSLTVFLGNQLSVQSVFLAWNQTLVGNLVHNLGTSNNLTQVTLEVRISGNLRGVLLVVVTRGARFVRLGRLRRLARLLRSSRTAIRRLVRLRGLGSLRGRGLYRLRLRRLAGLRGRRFLRLGRLLALRVTRLLRLTSLVAVTRRTRNFSLRGGGLRSRGLRLILGGHSLILIIDVLVLSNLIRIIRRSIRSLLTELIDRSRSQLLKRNRSLNRLSHIIVDGDGDRLLAFGLLRSEGSFTLAQDSLAIGLGNELSLQSVFLARNQTLVGNLINNLGSSNNLMRTILKISIRADLRSLLRSYSLILIIDVAVFGNLLLFVRVRSFLTVLVDLLGVQVLECDSSLDDTLNIVVDLDVNNLLAGRLLRGEGYFALADDIVLTLSILCLVTQLSLQGVFLTWHQVGVGNGVLDGDASLYLLSVVKISVGLNGRGPLGVNGLLLIVDVFVSSNHVFIGGASGLVAVLIYLGRYQLLEGNRSVNSRICLVVDSDLDVLLAGGLFRNQFLGAFTQYGFAICLGNQLRLQGVLLARNKVLIRHSVNNRGALLYTVAILNLGLRVDLRVPLGIDGLRLVINVLMLRNEVAIARVVRGILAALVHLVGVQLLESNGSSNWLLQLLIDVNLYLNVARLTLSFKGLRTGTKNSVLAVLVSSLVTQFSLQGVLLTRNQILVVNFVLNGGASNNLLLVAFKRSLGSNLRLEVLLLLFSTGNRSGRLGYLGGLLRGGRFSSGIFRSGFLSVRRLRIGSRLTIRGSLLTRILRSGLIGRIFFRLRSLRRSSRFLSFTFIVGQTRLIRRHYSLHAWSPVPTLINRKNHSDEIVFRLLRNL